MTLHLQGFSFYNGLVDVANFADVNETNAIVLFDGVCNLCNGIVQFVLKRDKNSYFKFCSLQSETAKRLLDQHPHINAVGFDSIVLIESDKIYVKSDAGLRILKRLGGWWKLVEVFYLFPKFIRDRVYNFIAHNRYKWFGKQDQCMVPTKEYANRFIS